MLNVIIADDEAKICTLIEKSIKWEELHMCLVGVCHNGVDLYRLIQEQEPHLIITDICMPGLNGIELIRKVRESGNHCKIIIISGYREFEYAQNALKYNVDDYLLKPIDEAELNIALRKLNQGMHSGHNAENGDARSHFMSSLIYDLQQRGEMNLPEINREYYTSFGEGIYRALYIKIDAAAKDYEEIDLYSVQRKIKDICLAHFEGNGVEILISISATSLLVGLNYSDSKDKTVCREMKTLLEHTERAIELFPTLSISIGVGDAYDKPIGLIQSIENAKEAVKYRITLGRSKVFFWEQIEHPSESLQDFLTGDVAHQIKQCFEICDVHSFKGHMEKVYVLHEHDNPILVYRGFFVVAKIFYKIIEDHFIEFEKNEYLKSEIEYGMQNALSLRELRDSVERPICNAMKALKEFKAQQENRPIRVAKQYVRDKYMKPIKLEDVALEVSLSTTYFSNLFKKETGQNFIDYLTDYRISIAKELLCKSDLNVNEIAYKTGYGEQRYFSKLFKKVVGIKPSEYRKLYS